MPQLLSALNNRFDLKQYSTANKICELFEQKIKQKNNHLKNHSINKYDLYSLREAIAKELHDRTGEKSYNNYQKMSKQLKQEFRESIAEALVNNISRCNIVYFYCHKHNTVQTIEVQGPELSCENPKNLPLPDSETTVLSLYVGANLAYPQEHERRAQLGFKTIKLPLDYQNSDEIHKMLNDVLFTKTFDNSIQDNNSQGKYTAISSP